MKTGIRISLPADEKTIRSLKAGDAVSISGLVITGRDKFHKWFSEGRAIPSGFENGALYHCGPVVVRDGEGWKVVAAGPTTSVRENPYEPAFIAATGLRIVIGKGGMDSRTLEAMREHGCIYVQATGGAAALAASRVKRVCGVDLLEEFGAAEACWRFDMEDFPGVVAMDSHGNSLFDSVAKRSAERLAALTVRHGESKKQRARQI